VLPPARRRLAAAGPTLAAAAAALAMLAAGPKAAPRREEGSRRPDRLGNAVREATTRAGPRAAERPRAAALPRPARAPPPTRARALRAVEIFDLFVSFYPLGPTPPPSTIHAPRITSIHTHTNTHTTHRHTCTHAQTPPHTAAHRAVTTRGFAFSVFRACPMCVPAPALLRPSARRKRGGSVEIGVQCTTRSSVYVSTPTFEHTHTHTPRSSETVGLLPCYTMDASGAALPHARGVWAAPSWAGRRFSADSVACCALRARTLRARALQPRTRAPPR